MIRSGKPMEEETIRPRISSCTLIGIEKVVEFKIIRTPRVGIKTGWNT
jgi:hypothetical protein